MEEDKNLLSKSNNIAPDNEVSSAGSGFWDTWRETLVVSGAFMSAYTAYLALQSLQSSINQEAGLGVVSLACLYGTIIISGMLTPTVMRVVGAKWSLVIAWVCHTLYTASNFYPTWATLIPASILLGGIASPMWTAQGLYLTACSERLSKRCGDTLHATLSRMNGFFFMCYECTQITGNLISSLVLTQGSYAGQDNVTLFCGADDCPGGGNSTTIVEPEQNIVYILLGVFLACDLLALVITVIFLPPLQSISTGAATAAEDAPPPGIWKTLVAWFTALSDPKLFFLIPFFMSSAMSQGILFVDFTKAFISCALGVSMVGFVMASHGAVTSSVAMFASQAAKYTGRYFLIGLAVLCNFAMLLTLLFWEPDDRYMAPFFVVPIIWGVAVGIFHTQFNCLVGLIFPEKKESAFANYHTWNAIGYTITFSYGGYLCVRTKLHVCLGIVGFGMLGYLGAEVLYRRQQNAAKESVKSLTYRPTDLTKTPEKQFISSIATQK